MLALATAALLLHAMPAAAQSLPSAARPAVAPEALTPPAPAAPGGLDLVTAPAGQPPTGAESVKLTLSALAVDGSTVYDAETLSAFYAGKIGTEVSLADIFAIAAAIEAAYRSDGYFLTRVVVPAQRIEGGAVKLVVVEGYIHSVAVVGDAGGSLDLVKDMAARISEDRGPARLATVERQLLLINDLPGISARGVLSPVAGERGASQLTIEVGHKAMDGFVAVDNRSSDLLGPWGATASAGVNSLTGMGERLDLVLFSSVFSDHQRLAQVSGDIALGSDGLRLRAYAGYAPGRPGGALQVLDVETAATRFGLSLAYPVLRGRTLSLSTRAAFDWLDEDDELLGVTNTSDRLRVLRLFADGEYHDEWAGVTRASLGLHMGVDAFGATTADDRNRSRVDGDGTFEKATLEVSRLQGLFSGEFGSLNLFVEATGQYAPGALLADEEFRLGGYRFGRGYTPGEISGDRALGASAELQLNGIIDHSDEAGQFHLPFQLYGFYDAGKVWDQGRTEISSAALTSAGAGVRLYVGDSIQGEIEVAKPLTRDRGDRSDDDKRNPGVFLRLVGSF
ncbi:ShlB/FhaC/HecB family hemolysin secretion/activation protein [Zavarzinia aquatilis]|uniref:POTRA domain-containing protein n=1 Tax=Zavarzinia aquatilis TaxID=2211142 RepID=A0A317EDQ9_9PROT|nr:ShlB/FhaC/HecB family hemolysin secretion/activation protein [Zavarzinia aquatilis]PWR25059.1 hypothetical protein DKG74_04640 [Zavarzinia aquatilis]